jgi:hypothetical protein
MSNHDSKGPRSSNGDAALERAWRESSAEQPPSHLDAAITAAARKSVSDRVAQPNTVPVRIQSQNWLTQWQSLVAAAVVAGLAFGLVQMLPREHDFAPPMHRKESAPVPAPAEPQPESRSRPESQPRAQPQSRSSSARETTDAGQAPSVNRPVGQRERAGVLHRAPAQNAVPAPPTATAGPAAKADSNVNHDVPEIPASDTASKAEATASGPAPTADAATALGEISADRREAVESAVPGRAATAEAAAPASRASEENFGNATSLEPPAWAAKVAALHASGDVTAAEHALREFRMAVPDADTYLPDSLRSWAQTVD